MPKMTKKEKESFMMTMRERFKQAVDFESENYDRMESDVKFSYGGRYQWDEGDYRQREEDNRPIITINRVKAPIRQVANDIRLNKPSIKVHPVDDKADPKIAKLFDGIIRNIERNSQAQVAYQCGAEGSIKAGFGAFEIRNYFEDEDTFEQDIKIERILNQFTVHFDPGAKKITKEDGTWAFIEDSVTEETYKRRWPKAEMVDFKGSDQTDWVIGKKIRIARYYVKDFVKRVLAQTNDGEVFELTDEMVNTGVAEGLDIRRQRTVKVPKVKMYIVSGADILEGPFDIPCRFIPIVPIYGEEVWIDGKARQNGIVQDARDPQKLYNFHRTSGVELINDAIRAPYLVTPGMIAGNVGQNWKNANKAKFPYLPFIADNGMAPIKIPPAQPPVDIWQESNIASEDLKFTTGVFDAGLGNQGPEQSGVAISARQSKSDIANYVYTDNLGIALQFGGKILIDMIPKVYDTQRVIRIIGEDEKEEMTEINKTIPGQNEKLNDITVGKYDVTVDMGPGYQTRRKESAESMGMFIGALPQEGAKISDLYVKAQDWPDSDIIADRLRKFLPPEIVGPDPDEEMTPEKEAAMQAQAEQAQQQAAQQQAMMDSLLAVNMTKAASQAAKTELDYAKAQETLASIDQAELENFFRVMAAIGQRQR